jgi:signal transduction histidine kinase
MMAATSTLPSDTSESPRSSRVALYAAVWTLLALLSALQSAASRARAGRPFAWPPLLADRFADWYSCALFTPAYVWLARHAPIARRTWPRGVAAHAAATTVFVVIKYALYVAAGMAIGTIAARDGYVATVADFLARSFVYESMILWAVAGVVHAMEFHRRAQEREAQAARLRAELTTARLDALAAQLRPHFLFNALNTVSSLMHRDVDAADAVLARLGDLLRRTLRAGDRHEVTLAEELELLGDYVAIVSARFSDRLTITCRIAPDVRTALVPHFLLQPLVENALEHGIARRAGAGRVEVRAARVTDAGGDRLRLVVADDGAGRDRLTERTPSEGIGLSNTRRRLAALYGDAHRLVLTDRPRGTGGAEVVVELPFREGRPPTPVASADEAERAAAQPVS